MRNIDTPGRASAAVDQEDEESPSFWAERGFFPVDPLADRGSARAPLTTDPHYKNLDFLRLKDFALHLLGPRQGMRILDLGCADGAQMVYCGLQGATVYGQDLSQEQVDRVNRKLAYLRLSGEARVGNATALGFEMATVDAVISSDFHEHLDASAQVATLRECLRVLKPGGTIVLKTPNLQYLRVSLWYKRLRALCKGRTPF